MVQVRGHCHCQRSPFNGLFFFRIYKIPDGKPENKFAFSGEAKNKKYATGIIDECHDAWRRLITGKTPSGDISM